MFQSKTVFVVGAGASAELKLPLGSEIKDRIVEILRVGIDGIGGYGSVSPVTAALEHLVRANICDERQLSISVDDVCQGLGVAYSIDNFLEAHDGNEAVATCGKIGITQAILEAEASSILMPPGHYGKAGLRREIGATWYRQIAEKLFSGVHKNDVSQIFENVSFVIFNYDRCVETHLFNAIQLYYRIDATQAADLLRSVSFYHPYGSVGTLPWLRHADRGVGIPFGKKDLNGSDLVNAAGGIRTFCERMGDNQNLEKLHSVITEANKVIFLGFAFHDQNMQLLQSSTRPGLRRVLGTAFKISGSDRVVIESQIRNVLQMKTHELVELTDSSCFDFFSAFSKSIS